MKAMWNDRTLARFVRRNIAHLARACWLASEWQASGADAEKDSDPAAAAEQLRDQRRFLRMEKTLRRYQANARTSKSEQEGGR